jgi:hypothetical protein
MLVILGTWFPVFFVYTVKYPFVYSSLFVNPFVLFWIYKRGSVAAVYQVAMGE